MYKHLYVDSNLQTQLFQQCTPKTSNDTSVNEAGISNSNIHM